MQPAVAPTTALVGRADELTALLGALGVGDPAVPGRAVLLAGDAGVGKTRLCTEAAARARAAGWLVVAGHCLDSGGDALPYLPFTEALGRLAAELPGLLDAVQEEHPALARVLPGRRAAGPDSRGAVFEAIAAALERAARDRPLLVVVEDVHWADASTRELLGYLLSRSPGPRAALLVTYRTDDLHRRHPLRADAAGWARLPGVTRLPLRPLPSTDVRRLVLELEPDRLPDDVVSGIVERAEGNAFYTEELVAAARRGEQVLSADLADLLLLHLDSLPDSARTLLRAMSVAGRQVSHPLLAAVAGPEGPEFDEAVRAAVDRNVLVPVGHDGYAFRHALLAEAVYDDLLPGERVRWHRRYVEVLSSGAVDRTAAELARHARAASDVPVAIAASKAAGEEALAAGGPAEAARHFENVLELLAQGGPGSAPVDEVVPLVVRASEAAVAAGLLHRGLALVEEQLASLPDDVDPRLRAELLHAVAATALLVDDGAPRLREVTDALALEPAQVPGELRAKLLAVQARATAAADEDAAAVLIAQEAAELARRLDLPAVLADATTTLARLGSYATADATEDALRLSVSDAAAAGDLLAEMRSTFNLGTVLYEAGRMEEARVVYDRGVARAVAVRRPWAAYALEVRLMSGLVRYALGQWDAALVALETEGTDAPPMPRAELEGAALLVQVGRGEQPFDRLPALQTWWERDGLLAVNCASAGIDLYGGAGRLDVAEAVHRDAVHRIAVLWGGEEFGARVRFGGLLLGQYASAAARSDAAERGDLLEKAAPLVEAAERAAERASRHGPELLAWQARVRAEHLRLRRLAGDEGVEREQLVDAWTAAVAGFERSGHVYETARSRTRLAAALRAAGRTAEAEHELVLSRRVASALGAAPLLAELAELGAPAPPAGGEQQLTPRELEVLQLLAQGRSNRDISTLLFISPKTVSVHVSNVLAKLHAAGRTEAVVIAQRRGLVTPVPADQR
ncbi:regulatory LuxR family protein [Motilibacter peucedani]|uniref:Regulatory LuxR family protein n=1 Tax=Motilibacter peucedani TaxID=598650 RepID=A0A420XSR5_9ACTN|nr:helix-turn-helix transcriptional regulator [Motilibacter peucedani]RKS77916.1 regulatory LuxR family protein [Motilibacter peucedani]